MSAPQPQPVESAEERYLAKQARQIFLIDEALTRANERKKAYEAAGDERSAWIQETVIDRLLRERKQVKP